MKDEDGKTKGGDGRNTADIKHSLWIIHSFCGTSLESIIVRREWEECGITLCKSGMEKCGLYALVIPVRFDRTV